MTAYPAPPAGAKVYAHPQGKRIYVLPDGSMQCWKPDGRKATSSATPEKLAAGHGAWSLLTEGEAPPTIEQPEEDEPAPAIAHPTVRLPMTFGSADVTELRTLATQPDVVIEQKFDGTRALAVITPTHVRFLGRGGQVLKHAAAAQHFRRLARELQALMSDPGDGEIVLDGEILTETGEFIIFDVPYARFGGGVEWSRPEQPLRERHRILDAIGETMRQAPGTFQRAKVARRAVTPRERQALVAEVEAAGGEGVMVKHLSSPYEPGRRVSHSLKVKFVKTADVVVLARDVDGAKNATLGVMVDGETVAIGGCSMIGKPDAQPGEVVEVAYLYWTGERLYQPRMMRRRPDRTPESCGMDQFPLYSRAVI